METKEIVIHIPSNFTEDQVNFIKQSAQLQIEAEMKRVLVVPQADIDAVEVEITAVKTANGLTEEPIK